MKKVVLILAGAVLLASCSPSKKEERALEQYSTAHEQLPDETPYGRTAWVQPPNPLPNNLEGRAWEPQAAPLLKPSGIPAQQFTGQQSVTPSLPTAKTSRKY